MNVSWPLFLLIIGRLTITQIGGVSNMLAIHQVSPPTTPWFRQEGATRMVEGRAMGNPT